MGIMDALIFSLGLTAIIIGVPTAVVYNQLSAKGQKVSEAQANVLAVLTRRIEIINRLISVASAYAKHESLTHITVAVNPASAASDLLAASREATFAINRIAAFIPNYPELKADNLYKAASDEIRLVESDLQARRETYNQAVNEHNTYRREFPNVIFSYGLQIEDREYFVVIAPHGDLTLNATDGKVSSA